MEFRFHVTQSHIFSREGSGVLVELYYYVPTADVENVVSCGLKLSRWYDKEVIIEGQRKKCMSAFLNPKDDLVRYKSDDFTCLKIEVPSKYCLVADRLLYLAGLENPSAMELYYKSMIPATDYMFGSIRLPECLVTCTIIEGQINVLNKLRDSPILFGDTEELYINNIIESLREENERFYDVALYLFFNKLAETEKLVKIEDLENKTAIFIEEKNDKSYIFRIPDNNQY